ncbi:hypothetical protein L208DRAFT_1215846, partial [Tricholoma matsutake]
KPAKPSKAKAKKPPKNACWSSAHDATLIKVLTEQQALGNQLDSGWKSLVWTAAADKLKGIIGKQYVTVHSHRFSGWGWVEDTHIVTATDGVWEAYIKAHPTAGWWRDESFPLYNDISPLVKGWHATG